MKKTSFLSAVLAVAALTAVGEPSVSAGDTNAPSPSAKQQWQSVESGITNTWQDVKQTTTQAWSAVKTSTTQTWANVKNSVHSATDYTYDKKNEFVTNAQADLDAMDKKIGEFSDKVASTGGSAKAGAQSKLQSLQDQRKTLGKKFDDVKNATESDWDDAKTTFKDSYDDTKSSLKAAGQWLDDKLKP